MFNVGDKVVTHPAGTVGTVTELLYRIENVHGTCVAAESELKRFVSPEEVWTNLGKQIGVWVWNKGLPIHEDEWAEIGNDAIDFLQENGVHPDREKDTTTINLLITTSIAAIQNSYSF